MSPLNRGPLMGPRLPPAGMRQLPPPRFVGRLVPHGMPPRGMLPPPMFGPGGPRQRLPPPPRPGPGAGGVSRPNGMLPRFPPGGPRARGLAPIVPSMGPRGAGLPRGPPMRPWPRRLPPPPQMMPHMRPHMRFGNGNAKGKAINNAKKVKIEELELKKPWMTDEIRNEIQRKNKLYAKAKKNKDAVEWEEFKDLRNKVTRMIRDAKNEYLAKHPEQAHLHPVDEEYDDRRDENYVSSDDDNATYYCEVCDRDFPSEVGLTEHKSTHMLCGIDGCKFSAHPLLVEKHISMQHRTGLYQRMKDLSTPEDIEKWIMERKKRYPTESNIKLRKAEQLEKLQRGEVIKQNYNVRTNTRKTANTREKRRKPRKRIAREITNGHVHKEETYRGLHPFAGIGNLQEDDVACLDEQMNGIDLHEKIIDNISDEEDLPQAPTAAESTDHTPTVTSLPTQFSLVADYESEDDDDGPEEVSIKRIKTEYLQNDKTTEAENLQDDKMTEMENLRDNKMIKTENLEDDKMIKTKNLQDDEIINTENLQDDKMKGNIIHEENPSAQASNTQSCTNASDESNNKFKNTVGKNEDKQTRESNQISYKNVKNPRRHSSLLEKLLSRAVQHERNLICQCVKYIIENNFFDIK